MNFIKLWILSDSKEQNLGDGSIPVLFNVNNIVSIKPIRILRGDDILNGYWIRTTNNKKYRASKIPSELEKLFVGDNMSTDIIQKIEAGNKAFIAEENLH